MTTLFHDIQALFERTYAKVGVNLEECLIDRTRCRQLGALAGAQAAELSMLALTFLRMADGRLRVGIYYSPWLIERLEANDPRAGLSAANIHPLIAFVEEINHAVHASLRFQAGEFPSSCEDYARNLELQAQVDTYLVLLLFVAVFRRPGGITAQDRWWLRDQMFDSRHHGAFRDSTLRSRYAEVNDLAARYTAHLEELSDRSRRREIALFHRLDYLRKKRRIQRVLGRRPARGETFPSAENQIMLAGIVYYIDIYIK